LRLNRPKRRPGVRGLKTESETPPKDWYPGILKDDQQHAPKSIDPHRQLNRA
jgi:hypothetical protein